MNSATYKRDSILTAVRFKVDSALIETKRLVTGINVDGYSALVEQRHHEWLLPSHVRVTGDLNTLPCLFVMAESVL